jgi:hypothetical protein
MESESNYIRLKKPRLLRIKHNEIEKRMIGPNLEYEYEKENAKLKKKINELNEMDKQLKEEEYNYEMNRLLTCFYKNPFCYMDYLVKKYFREKGNALENLRIKEEMVNKFTSLCQQIEEKIGNFTKSEFARIKNLERKIDNKLKNGDINIIKDDKSNLNNFNNFQSEPISNEELREYFFNYKPNNENDIEDEKLRELNNLLNSRPDAENLIINDKNSSLHQEQIFNQVLACVKGNEIVPPKQSFLTTNDIDLNYMKDNPTLDSKRLYEIKQKMKFEGGNKNENPIDQNEDRNILRKKLNNQQKNEKEKFEKMINDFEKGLNNIQNLQNENEKIMGKVKENLDREFEKNAIKLALTKLKVSEINLDTYQDEINKAKQYPLVDYKERKELMDQNYYKTQLRINNFLKGNNYKNNNIPISDKEIDKLYEKYKKKKNVKKKSKKKY